jgi:hypothetical protein
MARTFPILTALTPALTVALTACAPADADGAQGPTRGMRAAAGEARYMGVVTRLMDTDLVNFQVRMTGGDGATGAEAYARCAAAQYTLIRGYEYAQHVRTKLAKDGGIWTADAVYTISPSFPAGAVALSAPDVVAECRDRGIPTV